MEDVYIRCIGKDEKIHICKPQETITKCGTDIKKKNPTVHEQDGKYSCYECTY